MKTCSGGRHEASKMKLRQLGDFQTPPELIREILSLLGPIGRQWKRVLEPTCGCGNFIAEILRASSPPDEIVGIELQDHYLEEARRLAAPAHSRINIVKGNIFDISLREIKWQNQGPLLVIGNPPWVTNTEICSSHGTNLPYKNNFKGSRGIEAIMGSSNFDIAEYIWIKIISELQSEDAAIALLCKTQVARNVLVYAHRAGLKISKAEIRLIDAKKWFGAAVDACLFSVRLEKTEADFQALVFGSIAEPVPGKKIGFVGDHFVSDIDGYRSVSFIEGKSPMEWRQGLKHDAAPVMELIREDGIWKNGLGEGVDLEDEYIFPLIKSSDIGSRSKPHKIQRGVIVPQTEVNQKTRPLEKMAPRLWAYLSKHGEIFKSRKSSIYKGKAPFSIFGIGNYSFSPYKVIISGFYKEPRFIPVGPIKGKPVLCDDTCYLLPCKSGLQASVIAALLNHRLARQFIHSVYFQDSKRPITKAVLSRIDFKRIAQAIEFKDICDEITAGLKGMETEGDNQPELPVEWKSALILENSTLQESLFAL